MIARSMPMPCAPSATRCSEQVRPPTVRNTPSRDTSIFTGRFASLAAAAARIVGLHTMPLPPKPPPTNAARTRTPAGSMPNTLASVVRVNDRLCVVSCRSSWSSPVQAAIVVCGSIAFWL